MTTSITRRAFALSLLALPAAAQPMQHMQHDPLHISDAWARATAGQAANGAAYLTIANHGTAADRLVAAASPVARTVELHTHLMDNGVMRMRPVEAIEVDPGTPTVLQPSGLHVMLIGLVQPLREGESFPLTLRFAQGGERTVQVRVMGPGAMGPGGGMGAMPGMQHQH